MIITPVYKVRTKKDLFIQGIIGNKKLNENVSYFCHREDKTVYVYGYKFGTKLTIKQAQKYLELNELYSELLDMSRWNKIKIFDFIENGT